MPGLQRRAASLRPRRAGRASYQRQVLSPSDYQRQVIESEEDKAMTTPPQPGPDPQPEPAPPGEPPAEPEDEGDEAPEEPKPE